MTISAEDIWNKAVQKVKEKNFFPPLWQALDSAVPLSLEEDYIVLGFRPGTFHLRTHLETGSNRVLIEDILSNLMGKPYTLRVVEASTPEEWQVLKEKERSLEEAEIEEFARIRGTINILREWERFVIELHRIYSSLPHRSLPQVKAAFLYQIIPRILAKKKELHTEDEASRETNEKAFARMLDRLSSWTGIPSALIAYELLKREREG
ncbi:hypothetical protein H5T87_06325 [bacterium]|nr:hypothetical protein [bacterium]